MSIGKSRDWQAVAVPTRLQRAAAAEELDHRQRRSSSSGRARRPARPCPRGRGRRTPAGTSGRPTASMHTSAPLPSVSARIASTASCFAALTVWVAPNCLAQLELPVVEVDGDDRAARRRGARRRSPRCRRRRSRTRRRCRRGRPRRCTSPPRCRPSRRSRAGRRPSAARRGRPWCTGRRPRGSCSANAPMPSAGDSTVPSASVIFCVALKVEKQQPRLARAGSCGRCRTPPAS